MPPPPSQLRALIDGITCSRPSRGCIHEFVGLAYDLSKAYVRASRNAAVIESVLFRNQSSDLALDLIAELFERDECGRFVRVVAYFEDRHPEDATDEQLWIDTKSLVLGQVNDALFALYGDADRSLSRIIRNLKRVVRRLENVSIRRRATGLYLITGPDRPHRPHATYEQLERLIAPHVEDPFDLEHIVRTACRDIRLQDAISADILLTQFALCLRNARVRQHLPMSERTDARSIMNGRDMGELIRRSVRRVQKEKKDFYVRTERLASLEFEHVISAIELRLLVMADLDDRPISSNLESMIAVIPGLTESDYRDRYRNIYEYLFKLTRDDLVDLFNEEGVFSAART